jgi:hypothetical protein
MIEIQLQPVISNNLKVFTDLEAGKVVKIFNESYLSPLLLESMEKSWDSDHVFELSVSIPKTHYQVGETAKALLNLQYNGTQPVDVTSPGGQYFDLLIRDRQNNIVFQWERVQAGLPPSSPAPTEIKTPPPPLTASPPRNPFKTTLNQGDSLTAELEFRIPAAGTYYLCGRNYGGWDFGDIMAEYPDGSGYGLYMDTPFILVEVR